MRIGEGNSRCYDALFRATHAQWALPGTEGVSLISTKGPNRVQALTRCFLIGKTGRDNA